jgi:arylsulfatase A-like enzyme
MYEGGLRVPTAVVWKNNIIPGSVTEYKALPMDLFPTLTEATGIKMPVNIDGISFLPVLLGEKANDYEDNERVLYFTRREGGTTYGGLTIQAIQLDGWKLLQNNPFEPQELYNLNEDPYEKLNLIISESGKYKMLNDLMMKQIQHGGQIPWQKIGE